MIQAAIFDMDGVIIDSMPFWRQSTKEIMEEIGSQFSEKTWNTVSGKRIDEMVTQWRSVYPWKNVDNAIVVQRILDNTVRLIYEKDGAKPGALKALSFLREKGVPLAIASSSLEPAIEATVKRLQLQDIFTLTHSAQHEQYGKPHPAVYLSTAQMLKIEPENCIVFEDSINGMIAAKAAKMTCVGIPEDSTKNDPKRFVADVLLGSLEEVNEGFWQNVQNL